MYFKHLTRANYNLIKLIEAQRIARVGCPESRITNLEEIVSKLQEEIKKKDFSPSEKRDKNNVKK